MTDWSLVALSNIRIALSQQRGMRVLKVNPILYHNIDHYHAKKNSIEILLSSIAPSIGQYFFCIGPALLHDDHYQILQLTIICYETKERVKNQN